MLHSVVAEISELNAIYVRFIATTCSGILELQIADDESLTFSF